MNGFFVNDSKQDVNATITGSLANKSQRAIRWTEPKEIIIETYDGSGQMTHPSALYIPNGFAGHKYWMAGTPYPNSNNDYENASIYYSDDGENFFVPAGITNPIFPDPGGSQYNSDPELIYDGTNLILYNRLHISGTNDTLQFKVISDDMTVSVSTDCTLAGLNASSPVPILGYSPVITRLSATSWLMFTCASDGVTGLVQKFTSTNGTAWTIVDFKVPNNLDGNPWHFGATRTAEGYHFVVSAYPKGGQNIEGSLYYAYSKNGNSFDYDLTPMLMPEPGTWYDRGIYRSTIVRITGQRYRVYISTYDSAGKWHIGFFDIELVTKTDNLIGITQAKAFSGKAILDTNLTLSGTLPILNNYMHKQIVVLNSLDQAVDIQIYSSAVGGDFFNASAKTVGIGQIATITEADTGFSCLGAIFPTEINVNISAKCAIAPTTGSLTVYVTGIDQLR